MLRCRPPDAAAAEMLVFRAAGDRFALASSAYRFAAAATAVSMRPHGLLEGFVPTALFFIQFRCST